MAITVNQVQSQVEGAIRAFQKLSAREREAAPTATFVGHYSNLLMLAKEVMPEVDERRWPPDLGNGNTGIGQWSFDARFVEIHSYMEQLVDILQEGRTYG